MTPAERSRLTETVAQAERDLAELSDQVEAGEIDEETAARLRRSYARERDDAARKLAAAGPDADPQADTPDRPTVTRPRGRMLAGAAILVVALAVAVGMAGRLAGDRSDATPDTTAAGTAFDPSAFSNETLEAVIAGAEDDPAVADQLPFMRFRLAERYFEAGDFQKAFPHYEKIIEGDPPPDLAAAALTRVAWIVWLGNGEVDLAMGLLDRALEIVPGQTDALYVKGQLLWCGMGDAASAVPLFERVAADEGLDDQVASQVASDLAAARAGEPCT